MDLKKAIEILDYHQEWRQGKRDDMIYEPKVLTQALDIVLSEVKKLNQPDSGDLSESIDSSEDNFQCCSQCDLPDACADFGCAIKTGVRKFN